MTHTLRRGPGLQTPCKPPLRPALWPSERCALDLGCRELRLALLLAAQVTQHHGRELAAHVGRLHRALRPEEHAEWGPGVGPEYPELEYDHSPSSLYGGYEEEDPGLGSSSGSSGATGSGSGGLRPPPPSAFLAGAPGRVLPHPAVRWAMSASTLRFGDDRLEQRFQHWRNSRLAKVRRAPRRRAQLSGARACCAQPGMPPFPAWLPPTSLPLCCLPRRRWMALPCAPLCSTTWPPVSCRPRAAAASSA